MNHILLNELGLEPRIASRPQEQRQHNFDAQFDSETFCYDIIACKEKTIILSPPNTDECWQYFIKTTEFDGEQLHSGQYTLHKDKIHKLVIHKSITEIKTEHRIYIANKSHQNNAQCCLYTLQKDNDPSWIKDWAKWHIIKHKVDLLIIYDNNSTEYNLDTLKNEVETLNIETRIQSAPFKYGPGAFNGSWWDSDFLQYAMLEHVRYLNLSNRGIIVNSDIDELIVDRYNNSIQYYLSTNNSYVAFPGKWIDTEGSEHTSIQSHRNHILLDTQSKCPNKWAMNLTESPDTSALKVHGVSGGPTQVQTSNLIYLHHKKISTNWKYNRTNSSIGEHHKRVDPNTPSELPWD